YRTTGPQNRYKFALFIEKEGFDRALRPLAERYDVALFSTKGMPSTSCRQLVDRLSAEGVTILVLHDFDRSGINILNALHTSNDRYTFAREPKVIDIGLRLADR